jgi:hypothetical protein
MESSESGSIHDDKDSKLAPLRGIASWRVGAKVRQQTPLEKPRRTTAVANAAARRGTLKT